MVLVLVGCPLMYNVKPEYEAKPSDFADKLFANQILLRTTIERFVYKFTSIPFFILQLRFDHQCCYHFSFVFSSFLTSSAAHMSFCKKKKSFLFFYLQK